jgi:NAD(P)-dependent dehydrogenase (short-subunit alcohol dehydrogenase family)
MTGSRSLKELMDLSGRVALVTGGAGHIGAEIADALGELGAAVAVLDLDEAKARTVTEGVARRHGVGTMALAIDLADEAAARAAPGRVAEKFGRLDVLVNAAAFVGTSGLQGWAVSFDRQTADTWRRALEVNLTSAFVLVQAAEPLLAASGRGSVVNVASIYGMIGPDMRLYDGTAMGNPLAYGVAKGGLLQMTRWLATVLAPHVRVNAVTPGGVFRRQPDSFVERYADRTPLGRMAREEDIKGAVAYLASDLSAYVTGHNLIVDGGWTAW